QNVLGPSSVARENGQRPFWRRRFCHLKEPSVRPRISGPPGTRKSLMLPVNAAGGIQALVGSDIVIPARRFFLNFLLSCENDEQAKLIFRRFRFLVSWAFRWAARKIESWVARSLTDRCVPVFAA